MLNTQFLWDTYAMLIGKQAPFFPCLNLKVKALRTSETSRTTYRMIQLNISEDLKAPYFLLFLLHYWSCHLFIQRAKARMVWSYRKNARHKNGQSNTLLETHFKEANGKTEDTLGGRC